MVPVRTICDIIDVDFTGQDNWLKSHPFYAQLYRLSYTTGADGKQYKMSCLSIFDVDGWVSSITGPNRRPGSLDKQYLFLAWLRERKLEMYKSVELFVQENEEEVGLLTLIEEKRQAVADAERVMREGRKEIKGLEVELKQVRKKKYNGHANPNQTMLALN